MPETGTKRETLQREEELRNYFCDVNAVFQRIAILNEDAIKNYSEIEENKLKLEQIIFAYWRGKTNAVGRVYDEELSASVNFAEDAGFVDFEVGSHSIKISAKIRSGKLSEITRTETNVVEGTEIKETRKIEFANLSVSN